MGIIVKFKFISRVCANRFNRLLFLIGIFTLLAGCGASTTDPTVGFRNRTCDQIYQGAESALSHKHYAAAVRGFEALDALYPFGPYAEQAGLDLIFAYYQKGDVPCAEAAATRFIRLYPASCHVDYAYYMKGLADFEQDRTWFQRYVPTDLSQRDPGSGRQSFADFATLIDLYPCSPYVADARQHMLYLRNLFSAYELHVAKYYLRRGAYVAAANRANYMLQHYDRTPALEGGLGVMYLAYRCLGLPDLANQALAVLQYNYPNGCVLRAIMQGKPIPEFGIC